MQDIRANLERVRECVARDAERAGRRAEDVLLVGVSKTVDVARIRVALTAGLGALGEKRGQEARDKVPELSRSVQRHLVGHLQTHKGRDAQELFDVIHSVDRIDLARELDRRARAKGRTIDAFVQVNVGGELSKGGWPPEAVETAVQAVSALAGLKLRGLMTIPPAVERAAPPASGASGTTRARPRHAPPRAERHGLPELSMGMSADFEIAIEEGATMVRVGTAVFGPRVPRLPGLPGYPDVR